MSEIITREMIEQAFKEYTEGLAEQLGEDLPKLLAAVGKEIQNKIVKDIASPGTPINIAIRELLMGEIINSKDGK